MQTDLYNLIYVHRKTNEIVHAKRIIPGYYSIRHPITGMKETISRSKLKRLYEFQETISMENVRKNSQPIVGMKYA